MTWTVLFHPEFDAEFRSMASGWQDELLAHAVLLREYGPELGRPVVDTLKGTRHSNLKELRFGWKGGVWRVAFAFDPRRQAVLLVAGNKRGADERRFYRQLIAMAEARMTVHLNTLPVSPARKNQHG